MAAVSSTTVAILGASGMLGSDLLVVLGRSYRTCPIARENYEQWRGRAFDILINANGNSRRYWANRHPLEDFQASTVSVMASLFDFPAALYIYVSSPDVYADHTGPATTDEGSPGDPNTLSPYGLHKRLSETLVARYARSFLILRSAALLGAALGKGVFYDVLRGNPLHVTLDSALQCLTTRAVAEIIRALLHAGVRDEVFNIGGVGTVTPRDVGAWARRRVAARPDAEAQHYEMATTKLRAYYPVLATSAEYARRYINGDERL